MEHTPAIETDRLILRRFTEQDVEAVYRIFSDSEVNTFLPMFPLASRDEAERHLRENYLEQYGKPAGFRYAVCLRQDPVPVGYVHVSGNDSHDLGYGLRKEFWHRGIITEAARAVADKAREAGFPYITATHDVRNPRSGAVMKSIGMAYQYSYEELWQPKNIWVTFRMYQLNLDGQSARVYRAYWDTYPVHFVEENL